jgi:hypothetical protein
MNTMKNLIFAVSLLLVATSCNKWDEGKDKEKTLTYYSEDYKGTDLTLLDVPSSDMDAVWVEFNYNKESKVYDSYSLIVKAGCGTLNKESGTCTIDWEEKITFKPAGGEAYFGKWVSEKEKYTISFEGKTRNEELTFVYKDTGFDRWCKN